MALVLLNRRFFASWLPVGFASGGLHKEPGGKQQGVPSSCVFAVSVRTTPAPALPPSPVSGDKRQLPPGTPRTHHSSALPGCPHQLSSTSVSEVWTPEPWPLLQDSGNPDLPLFPPTVGVVAVSSLIISDHLPDLLLSHPPNTCVPVSHVNFPLLKYWVQFLLSWLDPDRRNWLYDVLLFIFLSEDCTVGE